MIGSKVSTVAPWLADTSWDATDNCGKLRNEIGSHNTTVCSKSLPWVSYSHDQIRREPSISAWAPSYSKETSWTAAAVQEWSKCTVSWQSVVQAPRDKNRAKIVQVAWVHKVWISRTISAHVAITT